MAETAPDDLVHPDELHGAHVERLGAELFEVTTAPVGWRCKQCSAVYTINPITRSTRCSR